MFLVPNLAAMLAAATLFYCLVLYGPSQLFRDSDSGWHIRTGQWILAHRSLPPSDLFSFSKAAEPWFAWEWLSDTLLGGLDRMGGLAAIAGFLSLIVALCTWLWCRLSFAAGGDFFLTALFAAPMVTTASLHWLARPHVLSWVFLLGTLLYAERCSVQLPRSRAAGLLTVAFVSALWANIHGSFFLGTAIALIYAVGHLAEDILWSRTGSSKWRWFLLCAAASVAGSLANPYGWKLHAHIFGYLTDNELTSRIAEFQSFNFHDKDAAQVVLVMAIAALGGVLALGQRKVAHFLLSVLLLVAALRSARVIPLVALLLLPLANGAIRTALDRASGLAPRLRRLLDTVLRESNGLRRWDRELSGAAFLVCVALLSALLLSRPAFSGAIQFPADRFPVAASAAVAGLPASARILSSDSFGGYLIYRFDGARKVFFDGRSDFYGSDFMKQYMVLSTARPGWKDLVRRYGFTHALLSADSALAAALTDAGWKTIYKDKSATLLEEVR
jgi:hypothetical protein